MSTCCETVETVVFLIGLAYLGRIAWTVIFTVWKMFAGTPATIQRYPSIKDNEKAPWAIVTGCTDGIGKGFALELAERGFNIVLISRSIDKLNATVKEVQERAQSVGKQIETRVLAFDFCETASIEAYT